MSGYSRWAFDRLKNSLGNCTKRKLVAFSVDDYCSVRLNDKEASRYLREQGVVAINLFDEVDALETNDDLLTLFDTLDSVRDLNGSHAIFSPFCVTRNPDFSFIRASNFNEYRSETVDLTFARKEDLQPTAYRGVWSTWKDGINERFLAPEFHGREHYNLKRFIQELDNKNAILLSSLKANSLVSVPLRNNERLTWAFASYKPDDLDYLKSIIKAGLEEFDRIFGLKSSVFTPPVHKLPLELDKTLEGMGIDYLDMPFYSTRFFLDGRTKRIVHSLKSKRSNRLGRMVRNVVFEPCMHHNIDSVELAMNQIKAAFDMRKPANISSHRVNYCGGIDKENRRIGLDNLRVLLSRITKTWPDVEFVSVGELGKILMQ